MDNSKILMTIIEEFPGLVDGETEVNGGDLVERLTQLLADAFTEGSPSDIKG